MSTRKKIKKKAKILWHFLLGWKTYFATGKTPDSAYHAMRATYFMSNGVIFDIIWFLHRLLCRKLSLPSQEGILRRKGIHEREALEHLQRDGLFICEQVLDSATVDALTQLACKAPANARNADPAIPDAAVDFNRPVSNIYDITGTSLVNNPVVQSIISDYSLISIAQSYLGTRPLLQNVTIWWSLTPDGMDVNLSRSAQMYHTDLDTIQWINFFFYLTDVDEHCGPHVFVRGSHRRKPRAVQKDGRVTDEEVKQHYPTRDILNICAPKGSMIIADTKALHKGNHLDPGHSRLMLQIRFAITRFGAECPPLGVRQDSLTPALGAAMTKNPEIYRNYLIAE